MANKNQKYKKTNQHEKQIMENYFVQGYGTDQGVLMFPTIDEVAVKFNISKNTLYKLAQRGDWKEKQDKFVYKYNEERNRKKRNLLMKEGIDIDDRMINLSKALLNKVMVTVRDKDKMSAYQIDSLASASLKIQKMVKLALGESTENFSIENKDSTNETFREALELIDEIRISRIRTEGSTSTH
tara:strand:- start:2063 stop:2614 length:552 start_codon:yes stop_codon:yes gene_type:complete